VRGSRGEMYIGHGGLCVCMSLSVPGCIPALLHGPGCNLGNGRGCCLVVHYWRICNRCTGFVAMFYSDLVVCFGLTENLLLRVSAVAASTLLPGRVTDCRVFRTCGSCMSVVRY